MIHYVTGDILKCDADALVNPVNCVGVMGAGLAKKFKAAFPENWKAYRNAAEQGRIKLGQMFVFKQSQQPVRRWPHYIINFPTKGKWQHKSRLKDIESGLAHLDLTIEDHNIRSIAIPALGCGLGGLDWADVKPLIVENLHDIASQVDVYLFEPGEPSGVSG